MVRKEHGGKDFRSPQGFNLAMPQKQCWKFISDPDAMISRIFKAKYFPKGDFWDSQLGHNHSYSWRSIWSSCVLVKEGIRWSIGDGSSIRVWTDPWLRDEDHLNFYDPILMHLLDMKVKDLFLP